MDNQGRKIVVCDNGTGVRNFLIFVCGAQERFKCFNKLLFSNSLSNADLLAAIFPNTYFPL
jgi:hypothetical protein